MTRSTLVPAVPYATAVTPPISSTRTRKPMAMSVLWKFCTE
ncbi:hypothetical protein [Streptomyces chartreusis]